MLVGVGWGWLIGWLFGVGWCRLVGVLVGWLFGWLVLVGVGWCWLVLVGVDWCWLVLVGVGWGWLGTINREESLRACDQAYGGSPPSRAVQTRHPLKVQAGRTAPGQPHLPRLSKRIRLMPHFERPANAQPRTRARR